MESQWKIYFSKTDETDEYVNTSSVHNHEMVNVIRYTTKVEIEKENRRKEDYREWLNSET